MMESKITNAYRRKLLQAMAGAYALPAVKGMAFGDGAIGGVPASESDTGLKNEIFRKQLDGWKEQEDRVIRFSCTLAEPDIPGYGINELALYDESGDLVAIKQFSEKIKDDDMEMIFDIDVAF